MKRKYHIVVARTFEGRWVMHFGDYDKECAVQECIDLKDEESRKNRNERLSLARVITLPDSMQATVDAKLRELNAAQVR